MLLKNPQIQHIDLPRTAQVLHGFGRHVVRPGTVPNLDMADWELELWTGSDMDSSVLDLEFGLETGPVTGLADTKFA